MKQKQEQKLYWCYGSGEGSEGATIEVEFADLGPVGNAAMQKESEQATNLTELGFIE